jgi:hypothetical protein
MISLLTSANIECDCVWNTVEMSLCNRSVNLSLIVDWASLMLCSLGNNDGKAHLPYILHRQHLNIAQTLLISGARTIILVGKSWTYQILNWRSYSNGINWMIGNGIWWVSQYVGQIHPDHKNKLLALLNALILITGVMQFCTTVLPTWVNNQ